MFRRTTIKSRSTPESMTFSCTRQIDAIKTQVCLVSAGLSEMDSTFPFPCSVHKALSGLRGGVSNILMADHEYHQNVSLLAQNFPKCHSRHYNSIFLSLCLSFSMPRQRPEKLKSFFLPHLSYVHQRSRLLESFEPTIPLASKPKS